MKTLRNLLILTILLLLNCSNGYCQNNSNNIDSISISIDDVRKLNSKLLDYEYTKEELKLYQELYNNDEIIIEDLKTNYSKEHKKNIIWSKTSFGLVVICIILLVI